MTVIDFATRVRLDEPDIRDWPTRVCPTWCDGDCVGGQTITYPDHEYHDTHVHIRHLGTVDGTTVELQLSREVDGTTSERINLIQHGRLVSVDAAALQSILSPRDPRSPSASPVMGGDRATTEAV